MLHKRLTLKQEHKRAHSSPPCTNVSGARTMHILTGSRI